MKIVISTTGKKERVIKSILKQAQRSKLDCEVIEEATYSHKDALRQAAEKADKEAKEKAEAEAIEKRRIAAEKKAAQREAAKDKKDAKAAAKAKKKADKKK